MAMPRRKWLGVAAGAVAGGLSVAGGEAAARTTAGATFEIYQDAKKEYRWRLKSSNGKVIATGGQGYKAKADCRHGIELVQNEAAKAKIEETSEKE